MRVAITGGTGFVGRHLARAVADGGHEVVVIARGQDRRDDGIRSHPRVTFVPADLTDDERLRRALVGCDAVAHFAGINRELGGQTYRRVHVAGTRAVVAAARGAGVGKIVLLSFLRARPDCGSPYHESKWQAEEIVRASGLDYTILKAGMIYGRGDHMLDHLSHALHTFPIFALVGWRDWPVRPVAVEDVVALSMAALLQGRLPRRTVAVTGPDELTLEQAVRRVAAVVGRQPWFFRLPITAHYALAWCFEQTMRVPLVAWAQVRILSEDGVQPLPACPPPPADLQPRIGFTQEQIRRGLPAPGPFGWHDCRWVSRPAGR